VWLGFTPAVVASTLAANLLYQFWIHAPWIPRLGWLEHVLNTPSAHHVHHASQSAYLDANFGGVPIVSDKSFGTCVAERDDLPCRYGLVHRQTSHNLLRIEFDGWLELFRDLRQVRSIRTFMGLLLMPPGWRPPDAS
jgi:sterol desaturase/sphingolipid hydroxylase (fatty acid hydroxylase superfamily)